MNRMVDLGRRLSQHFAAEAPNRAPDWVLGAALASIDDTRQRRVLIHVPWRFPTMNGISKLAAAAVAVLAVGILGIAVIGPGGGSGGPPTPTPGPTASPTGAPTLIVTPAPTQATSGLFRPAFTFLFPTGVTFDYGTVNSTWFEVRVPEFNDAGHAGGIILQNIGGGRADQCDGASAAEPIATGPAAVIEYLKTIPELTVTNERATTVSGLPAREATVVADPETPACPDMWLWVEDSESFGSIPRGLVLRMISVDVAGEHLVFTIYGEPENSGWKDMADQLIASVVFTE